MSNVPFDLVSDPFLSELLSHPVFQLKLEGSGPTPWKAPQGQAMIWSKVRTRDHRGVHWLEDQGFHLVDSNVQFQLSTRLEGSANNDKHSHSMTPISKPQSEVQIRLARATDEKEIVRIAGDSFELSRFHTDPFFPTHVARLIKEAWVANFFKGLRGQAMIIAEIDNQTAGFIQVLLDSSRSLATIDLIATSAQFRKRGVATSMIRWMIDHYSSTFSHVLVGTQLQNSPSLQLYEKLGFRISETFYVFHRHS